MAWGIGMMLMGLALAISACCVIEQVRGSRRPPHGVTVEVFLQRPSSARRAADRLADLTAAWLADERPAWETVDEFEADVDRVLRGRRTRGPIEALTFQPRDSTLAERR